MFWSTLCICGVSDYYSADRHPRSKYPRICGMPVPIFLGTFDPTFDLPPEIWYPATATDVSDVYSVQTVKQMHAFGGSTTTR